MSLRDWWPAAVFLPVYVALVQRFWWTCDDAYISWRFARNLMRGEGIRYNLGDHVPVEGYSNFGWVVLSAAVGSVGLDMVTVVPMISAVLGAVLLLWVHRTLLQLEVPAPTAGLAVLALTAVPSIPIWATSGLAAMPFTLALFVAFERLVISRDPVGGAVAAVALALVRTEGIYWGGVLFGMAAVLTLVEPERREDRRGLAASFGALLAVYAVYYGWRVSYYETLAANTATAKTELSWPFLVRGMQYAGNFHATTLVPALCWLAAPVVMLRHRGVGVCIAAMSFGPTAFSVLVGGDYMAFGRFLVGGLPFACLLGGLGLAALRPAVGLPVGVFAVVLAALPGWNVHLVPREILTHDLAFRYQAKFYRTEYEQWDRMKRNIVPRKRNGLLLAELAEPDTAWILGGIGALGYYSDIFIYDSAGLVTREIAERPTKRLMSPGHDKVTSFLALIHHEPSWARADVVGGRKAAVKMVESWNAAKVSDRYVPRIVRKQGKFAVILQRYEGSGDPLDDWVRFRDGYDADLPWLERKLQKRARVAHGGGVTLEDAAAVQPGDTLLLSGDTPVAELIGPQGELKARWQAEIPDDWIVPKGRKEQSFRRALLLGRDLIVVFAGIGIARLAPDSTVRWGLANSARDVVLDTDGTLVVTTATAGLRKPIAGLQRLSLDGEVLDQMRIPVDALPGKGPLRPRGLALLPDQRLLVTLSGRDVLVAVDFAERSAAIVASDVGQKANDAEPTEAGFVLFHRKGKGSRAVERAADGTELWAYDDASLDGRSGGSVQRLPNGNTLLTSRASGRVLEITADGRTVWSYATSTADGKVPPLNDAVRIPAAAASPPPAPAPGGPPPGPRTAPPLRPR